MDSRVPIVALSLLLICPTIVFSAKEQSHFKVVDENLSSRSVPDHRTSNTYTNVVGTSSYSSYGNENKHFQQPTHIPIPNPYYRRNQFENVGGTHRDATVKPYYRPALERGWYPHIIDIDRGEDDKKKKEEKMKMKDKGKEEMPVGYSGYTGYAAEPHGYQGQAGYAPPPAPLPPPTVVKDDSKDKIDNSGPAQRALLLLSFLIFLIYVLVYDAFDRVTGLGREGNTELGIEGRAYTIFGPPNKENVRIITNILESIDVPELTFDLIGIQEVECRQMAFCNIRKILTLIPRMERFLDIMGFSSAVKTKYSKGDKAGRHEQSCRKSFAGCSKYKYSL